MRGTPSPVAGTNGNAPGIVIHVLMLIYILSGACALIDEVVWVRLLKLTLGNTVYASSIVVSVFMAGLALGSVLMGRYADSVAKPLRLYALVELAVTVLALLSPWTLRAADGLYMGLYRSWQGVPNGLLVGQIAAAAFILLVPTLLMGSTLPLVGRFVTSVEKETGPLVGRLYALNTLGAAAGCFLAGFVLLKAMGVMGTLRLAGLLNLLAAGGAYALHRVWLARTSPARTVAGPRPDPAPGVTTHDTGLLLLALGFFVSGAVSIGYELLWMRSIVHTAGAFTFVFSSVLTTYLVGNVLGAAIGSRIVGSLRNPAAAAAALLSVLGVCGVLYLPWLNLCNYHLFPWVLGPMDESIWYRPLPWNLLGPLLRSAVLFLPPSILMGIAFPIMLQAWVDRAHRVGWSTGTACGTNTWGAVAGGLLTGFVLLPGWGLQATVTRLGLTAVWVGSLAWWYFVRPAAPQPWRRWLMPLAALCLTVQGAQLPDNLFLKTVALSRWVRDCEILDVKEGINTTVSIHRDPRDQSLYLCTSGCRVAGTSHDYRGDQKMLGHFPVLLNRHARSVLSVGFGSGESTACLARHALDRVDCVEIAPEVVDLARKYFRAINLGDELEEQVTMIYQDAKNYLRLTDRRYDVIVNDCTSMRGVAENASLYCKEYFESARDRLTDEGLFMSWIDTFASECPQVTHSVIGTMMDVFPHVTLWYLTTDPGPYFVIVGSCRPQSFSPRHIANELARPAVAVSLAEVDCRDALDVLTCYIADEKDLRNYVTRYATNSDYFPVLEFCTEPEPGNYRALHQFFTTIRGQSLCDHIDWTGIDAPERQQWLERVEQARGVATHVLMAASAPDYFLALQYTRAGLRAGPGHPALCALRRAAEQALLEDALQSLQAGNAGRAVQVYRRMLEVDPNSAPAWVLRSQAERSLGNLPAARAAAERALEIAPADLSVQLNLWSILVAADDPTGAAAFLRDRVLPTRKRAASPDAGPE